MEMEPVLLMMYVLVMKDMLEMNANIQYALDMHHIKTWFATMEVGSVFCLILVFVIVDSQVIGVFQYALVLMLRMVVFVLLMETVPILITVSVRKDILDIFAILQSAMV